ncbi:MAG: acyl carrier protein [Oscillospiraceae bacterium]|nr:acyl carrier protein [Oscillospiraceae bacterium]MCI9526859.1 acyl carrier protein [Lachnospiraceae bacterium]
MDNAKKIELLEEMLDVDSGTLKPEMVLEEIDEWDSMAKISLIVLMDEECGKKLTSTELKQFKTIQDIMNFMDA